MRLGSLGSTEPISTRWGYDRGLPVDRWYIERFLAENRRDITGRVLEVQDSTYTDRYGHAVSERAVLDLDPGNALATHVADLTVGDGLPSEAFDCFVLTQTLHIIYDMPAALAQIRRILRPGGVLLATAPVASMIDPPDLDCWRVTPLAFRRLLTDAFGAGNVSVEAHGNVLSQIAFLKGLAAEDLTDAELEADDPLYPLLVCARVVREP
jgi:SAM-dependent methyltransferase